MCETLHSILLQRWGLCANCYHPALRLKGRSDALASETAWHVVYTVVPGCCCVQELADAELLLTRGR